MSVMQIPLNTDMDLLNLLQKILSINVADSFLILVGLLIKGKYEKEYSISINSDVGICLSFSKFMLKSSIK